MGASWRWVVFSFLAMAVASRWQLEKPANSVLFDLSRGFAGRLLTGRNMPSRFASGVVDRKFDPSGGTARSADNRAGDQIAKITLNHRIRARFRALLTCLSTRPEAADETLFISSHKSTARFSSAVPFKRTNRCPIRRYAGSIYKREGIENSDRKRSAS